MPTTELDALIQNQLQNNLFHGIILFILVTTLIVAFFHSHFRSKR